MAPYNSIRCIPSLWKPRDLDLLNGLLADAFSLAAKLKI